MTRSLDRALRVVLVSAAFATSGAAQAQTEIQWWHSMGGALGEALNGLADKFNASQKDYKVVTDLQGLVPGIDDRRRSRRSAPATRRTCCRCSRSARRR